MGSRVAAKKSSTSAKKPSSSAKGKADLSEALKVSDYTPEQMLIDKACEKLQEHYKDTAYKMSVEGGVLLVRGIQEEEIPKVKKYLFDHYKQKDGTLPFSYGFKYKPSVVEGEEPVTVEAEKEEADQLTDTEVEDLMDTLSENEVSGDLKEEVNARHDEAKSSEVTASDLVEELLADTDADTW